MNTYLSLIFFFFNDTATTEIYTLSLHDALPIYKVEARAQPEPVELARLHPECRMASISTSAPRSASPGCRDRKSTRLNSSHLVISYAVFCLKKKKKGYEYNKEAGSIILRSV